MTKLSLKPRAISIAAFSFLFAYILSFPFEGKVLYSLLDAAKVDASQFVLAAIIAHFLGQFTCGFFCKSPKAAKRTMLLGMGVCIPLTAAFFLAKPVLWLCALRGNEIILRPVKAVSGGEFAEQILADLIAKGISGSELLDAFRAEQKKVQHCTFSGIAAEVM